jgi:hypothetical protein
MKRFSARWSLSRSLSVCKFGALTWAVLFVASVHTAKAGINVWTSHGPYDGFVNALAINPTTPSTLYAGTYGGGVFQSTNSGGSWSAVNIGV